jgi:hypothetical protein
LTNNFDFDSETELFNIRKDSKLTINIPLADRIKFYLVSYMRRMERERKIVTFDEIVLNIMPLLKNGVTPDNQTILNVLESIAEKVGEDSWKLSNGELF